MGGGFITLQATKSSTGWDLVNMSLQKLTSKGITGQGGKPLKGRDTEFCLFRNGEKGDGAGGGSGGAEGKIVEDSELVFERERLAKGGAGTPAGGAGGGATLTLSLAHRAGLEQGGKGGKGKEGGSAGGTSALGAESSGGGGGGSKGADKGAGKPRESDLSSNGGDGEAVGERQGGAAEQEKDGAGGGNGEQGGGEIGEGEEGDAGFEFVRQGQNGLSLARDDSSSEDGEGDSDDEELGALQNFDVFSDREGVLYKEGKRSGLNVGNVVSKLSLKGSKEWKKRWVRLSDHVLIYYEEQAKESYDSTGRYPPLELMKGLIELKDCEVTPIPPRAGRPDVFPFELQVKGFNEKFVFGAPSQMQQLAWVACIKNNINYKTKITASWVARDEKQKAEMRVFKKNIALLEKRVEEERVAFQRYEIQQAERNMEMDSNQKLWKEHPALVLEVDRLRHLHTSDVKARDEALGVLQEEVAAVRQQLRRLKQDNSELKLAASVARSAAAAAQSHQGQSGGNGDTNNGQPSNKPEKAKEEAEEDSEQVAQLEALCRNLTADVASERRCVGELEEDKRILVKEVKRLGRRVLKLSRAKTKNTS